MHEDKFDLGYDVKKAPSTSNGYTTTNKILIKVQEWGSPCTPKIFCMSSSSQLLRHGNSNWKDSHLPQCYLVIH